jgi:branched-chain amino acid aminotransferase
VFGTGTAATISKIKELCYRDLTMKFDTDNWKISAEIISRMNAIKSNKAEDKYGWMVRI